MYWLFWVLWALLGLICLLLLSIWKFQDMAVYVPNIPGVPNWISPQSFGLQDHLQDVYFTTSDNVKLHGWFCSSITQNPSTCPTILFFHSNAGNISHRLANIRGALEHFGCNLFFMDYRGFGKSEGKPSEKGIKLDSEASLNYLLSRNDINKQKIIVFGRSIGGAVASYLSSIQPNQIAGLVLENTFTSLPDLIPHVAPPLKFLAKLSRNKWNTLELFANGAMPHIPILFLSSLKDEMVPLEQMRKLEIVATNSSHDVKIVEFKEGHHMNLPNCSGYYEAITNWIDSKFPPN